MKPILLTALLILAGCGKSKLEEAQDIHVLLLDRLAAQAEEVKRQSNVIRLYQASLERYLNAFEPCDAAYWKNAYFVMLAWQSNHTQVCNIAAQSDLLRPKFEEYGSQ